MEEKEETNKQKKDFSVVVNIFPEIKAIIHHYLINRVN